MNHLERRLNRGQACDFAILSSEQLSRLGPAKDDTPNSQSAPQPLVAKELLYLKSVARSNLSDCLRQVETVCRIPREDFCGTSKSAPAVMAKEMLILIGLQLGASMKVLSEIIGISPSALSRRHDAARRKLRDNANRRKLVSEIIQQYGSGAD